MNSQTLQLVHACDELLVSKLSLLSQLSVQLRAYTLSLDDENFLGLEVNFSEQEELMNQLDVLEAKYKSAIEDLDSSDALQIEQAFAQPGTISGPEWCGSLLLHLREQEKLLQEISILNQQAKSKSLTLLNDAKDHLKTIKSQKDMMNGYYQYASMRPGRILDTK